MAATRTSNGPPHIVWQHTKANMHITLPPKATANHNEEEFLMAFTPSQWAKQNAAERNSADQRAETQHFASGLLPTMHRDTASGIGWRNNFARAAMSDFIPVELQQLHGMLSLQVTTKPIVPPKPNRLSKTAAPSLPKLRTVVQGPPDSPLVAPAAVIDEHINLRACSPMEDVTMPQAAVTSQLKETSVHPVPEVTWRRRPAILKHEHLEGACVNPTQFMAAPPLPPSKKTLSTNLSVSALSFSMEATTTRSSSNNNTVKPNLPKRRNSFVAQVIPIDKPPVAAPLVVEARTNRDDGKTRLLDAMRKINVEPVLVRKASVANLASTLAGASRAQSPAVSEYSDVLGLHESDSAQLHDRSMSSKSSVINQHSVAEFSQAVQNKLAGKVGGLDNLVRLMHSDYDSDKEETAPLRRVASTQAQRPPHTGFQPPKLAGHGFSSMLFDDEVLVSPDEPEPIHTGRSLDSGDVDNILEGLHEDDQKQHSRLQRKRNPLKSSE